MRARSAGNNTPDQEPGTGRFLPGNRASHRHGLYAQVGADLLASMREEFLAQSLRDDGGETEVPARRRSLHVYRARLHVHIEQLSDAIERMGLFDGRGRLRSLWLQRLEGLVARAQAIDATLGLARRTKRVQTLAEVMREQD